MEKIAVIDLGSNKVRIVFAYVVSGGHFVVFDELDDVGHGSPRGLMKGENGRSLTVASREHASRMNRRGLERCLARLDVDLKAHRGAAVLLHELIAAALQLEGEPLVGERVGRFTALRARRHKLLVGLAEMRLDRMLKSDSIRFLPIQSSIKG